MLLFLKAIMKACDFSKRVGMKKRLLTMAFSLVANMGYAEHFGSVEDYSQQVTVAGAKQLSDDAKVSLEGFITGHLRGDHYLFRDDSGKIGIEIEPDIWDRKQIGPDTEVRIDGELEHESGFIYIEVHRLEISETFPGK